MRSSLLFEDRREGRRGGDGDSRMYIYGMFFNGGYRDMDIWGNKLRVIIIRLIMIVSTLALNILWCV